jgi:nucleotide-binding universal stress UspA family protein
MIKDILVNLSVTRSHDIAGEYAVSLALKTDAHLTAVAFAYEPVIPGSVFDGVAPSIIDSCRAENQKTAQKAKHQFDETARRAGASSESSIVSAGTASATDRFGKMARRYDLAVVAQAQPNDDLVENEIIQSALFNAGRPVLVVPYIQKNAFKVDRVMVCWDGSRSAARAIGDAIPLIQRAGKIEVVTIEPRERQNELSSADIALHLARHDLKVELKPIVAPGADVANTLLSYAADSSIDLIVMGGYGHSRLREFVLGGATRGILQSMTVPTLMSH